MDRSDGVRHLVFLLVVLSAGFSAAQARVYIVSNPPSDKQVCSKFGCGPEFVFTYENAVSNLTKHCKRTVIAADAEKADYVLRTRYDDDFNGGLTVTLLNKDGDVVYSKKTRHISNAFKDMCKDFLEKKSR
jgi:hypothetical protein